MSIDLRLGNCISLMKTLSDDSVDLVITSPPYYNAREYSHWNSYEDYLSFLREVSVELFRVVKKGHFVAVNLSVVIEPRLNRQNESRRIPIPFHYVNLMEDLGFKFLEDIIWLKPEGSAKNRNAGFYRNRQPIQYKPNIVNEYILVFQKHCKGLIDNIIRGYDSEVRNRSLINGDYERSNVWKINPETHSFHSAPFPLQIPMNLIKYYSYVGDTVLDCFMGSGTTGVACKELDRSFIGIELDETYYNLAKERIECTLHQISLFNI